MLMLQLNTVRDGKMEPIHPNFMLSVAEQLSFVCAFLGGVSATILITLVVFSSDKKSVSWMTLSSALAACSFFIAVIASWRITYLLDPHIHIIVEDSLLAFLYKAMLLGYGLGFLSLLMSIGLSGWLRSKRDGVITSVIALISVLFFIMMTPHG